MKTITLEVTDERYEELLKESTLPKKQSRYVPKVDEEYWYVSSGGKEDYCRWRNDEYDIFRLGQNNVFKTEAEAEKHSAKHQAISEVTNYCYENDLVLECDWENLTQEKWRIYYSFNDKKFGYWKYTLSKEVNFLPFLKSTEACNQVIKEKEEALKLIFEI